MADDYFRQGLTPEGVPFRVVGSGELAMGGPHFHTILFPDGVLLEGVGYDARFSRDGRYFAAQRPERGGDGLLVLDRQERRIYHARNHADFWRLDEFASAPPGACNAGEQPVGPSPGFRDFLARAQVESLAPIVDLWVEPQVLHAHEKVTAAYEYPSPDGRRKLVARRVIPRSPRHLGNPCGFVYAPDYALSLDGEAAGLLLNEPETVAWQSDSLALVCRARAASRARKAEKDADGPHGFWLWEHGKGWRALPEVWRHTPGEPSLNTDRKAALVAHELWLNAEMPNPELRGGSQGYFISFSYSATERTVGHHEDGQAQSAARPCRPVRLILPLDSRGGRGTVRVESAGLNDSSRAVFTWDHDNLAGLGGWHCRIGDWALPGLWLLDHCVVDSGAHIVLCPFAEKAHTAGSFVVAAPATRDLFTGPELLIRCLQDFCQDTVSVIEIAGRLKNPGERGPGIAPGTPLAPFESPAPRPDEADDFFRHETGGSASRYRYWYRQRRFRFDAVDGITSISL
uniref:hypothetical protein n=1 Tax=Castellaniella defragrans TaxID=75697 RepID=UPI00333F898F